VDVRRLTSTLYVHVAVAVHVYVHADVDGHVVRLRESVACNDGGSTSTWVRVLSYQRLDVYQCAIKVVAECARLSKGVPAGYADLADQVRRASISISLNIAEGVGRTTSKDAARHYAIARGSAMECAAILDALTAIGAHDPKSVADATALLVRIVEMLTKMCR
jgi:four helix bundle protein